MARSYSNGNYYSVSQIMEILGVGRPAARTYISELNTRMLEEYPGAFKKEYYVSRKYFHQCNPLAPTIEEIEKTKKAAVDQTAEGK